MQSHPEEMSVCKGLLALEIQKIHHIWLVVSTHFKNISQIGNLPQVGVKIKNIWVATT